jgi:AAA15 family ATPase/GTPase
MLNSLVIKNFRMLEDFTVEKLGRVNLIVGKNNSGKSTVLEALRIYAGNANQSLLEKIADSHDEKSRLNNNDMGQFNMSLPFEDLFIGRSFPEEEGRKIIIGESATDKQALFIQHVFFVDRVEQQHGFHVSTSYPEIISKSNIESLNIPFKQALWIEKDELSFLIRFENYPYTTLPRHSSLYSFPIESFIPTQFISINELAYEWENLVSTNYGTVVKIVTDTLKIVLPEYESLFFVSNYPGDVNRIAKVKLTNLSHLVPLKSLGDGMIRVLQLALKLISAQGGFLLIDEFENGLHYSVQENVWRLLFEMAEKLDIQVFATTHSWDCIESFVSVAQQKTEADAVLFRMGKSVGKSDYGKVISTVFSGDDLSYITQSNMEIR